MKTKTKSECKTKGLCHYDGLTRAKFFDGMLLTAEHLRADQNYHRESQKRLNRHLWGSGIVCGLEVRKVGTKETGLCIKVEPGLALDCDGNVIDVGKSITIDLAQICKDAYPDGCEPADVKPIVKYLVIRYGEVAADPQPVLTPDDDCGQPSDRPKCEGSKYREGFCLDFVDKCPNCKPCHAEDEAGVKGLLYTFFSVLDDPYNDDDDKIQKAWEENKEDCMTSPRCPDCHCCEDAAVGLAKITIDCDLNKVKVECECRQFVWSPRLLQTVICGLLANIHKLDSHGTAFKIAPEANALLSDPQKTLWDVGGLALRAQAINRLRRDRTDVIRVREEFEELKKYVNANVRVRAKGPGHTP